MRLRRLSRQVAKWIGRPLRSVHSPERALRGPRSHVIILDGTLSTLERGQETHAGIAYRLCSEMGAQVSVYYESGVQWTGLSRAHDVMRDGIEVLSMPNFEFLKSDHY